METEFTHLQIVQGRFEKPTQIEFDAFMTVLTNLSQMLKTSREASYQPVELKRGQKVLLRMLP